MTLAQQAARNRANLEHAARIKHDQRFDRAARGEHKNMLLLLAVLVSGAFMMSAKAIAKLDGEGAKPGDIHLKSELTKQQLDALNVIPYVSEKRTNYRQQH